MCIKSPFSKRIETHEINLSRVIKSNTTTQNLKLEREIEKKLMILSMHLDGYFESGFV